MTARGSRFDWVLFVAMGFFWGSSYVFINTGLDHGPQPFTLIMFRFAIGFVLLASVVAYFREPLPAISLPGASSLFGPNRARDRIGADDRGSPNSVSGDGSHAHISADIGTPRYPTCTTQACRCLESLLAPGDPPERCGHPSRAPSKRAEFYALRQRSPTVRDARNASLALVCVFGPSGWRDGGLQLSRPGRASRLRSRPQCGSRRRACPGCSRRGRRPCSR
jgi:hypothetical protein